VTLPLTVAVAVGPAQNPTAAMVSLWLIVGLAAAWDIAQRRIPNGLILIGLVLGAAMEARSGGLVGLGLSALGAFVALGVLIVPFALRRLGGGDVKLAMVCGAFLGWRGALHVILIGAIVHGGIALATLLWKRAAPALGRPEPDLDTLPHAVGYAVAATLYSVGIAHLF
jgi:Flp pilus assembly protein protease CpaA